MQAYFALVSFGIIFWNFKMLIKTLLFLIINDVKHIKWVKMIKFDLKVWLQDTEKKYGLAGNS